MAPFWETKTLETMTQREWESLCDGCGRCCLHKLRDEDTGVLSLTNVACRLLDTATARCRDYAHRKRRVPDCIRLTPRIVRRSDWLPPSCAYRLLAEGKPLPPWHPLRSGAADSVVKSGASVINRVISERDAGPLEHHVTDWPGRRPRRRTPETTYSETA